jgi:hypothetical protein
MWESNTDNDGSKMSDRGSDSDSDLRAPPAKRVRTKAPTTKDEKIFFHTRGLEAGDYMRSVELIKNSGLPTLSILTFVMKYGQEFPWNRRHHPHRRRKEAIQVAKKARLPLL